MSFGNIKIPIKPISINECWQGRRFKTKKYDKFIIDMLRVMPKREMLTGSIKLEIRLYLKSLLRGDIDNFIKPIVDCVVKKGWIKDDIFIVLLEVEKFKSAEEFFEIELKKLT